MMQANRRTIQLLQATHRRGGATSKHNFAIARSLASSTTATASLQSFKYDAPWIHQADGQTPTMKNFINGSFEAPDETSSSQNNNNTMMIPIYDPSTNSLLSTVPESHHENENENSALNRAVAAAKAAYPSWSNTPVQNRQRLLLEYAHFLHKKEVREEIA